MKRRLKKPPSKRSVSQSELVRWLGTCRQYIAGHLRDSAGQRGTVAGGAAPFDLSPDDPAKGKQGARRSVQPCRPIYRDIDYHAGFALAHPWNGLPKASLERVKRDSG